MKKNIEWKKGRNSSPRICIVTKTANNIFGARARALAEHVGQRLNISILYADAVGLWGSLKCFLYILNEIWKGRYNFVYLISQHPARVLAATLARLLLGCRFCIDTGDVVYELRRDIGVMNPLSLVGLKLWESFSLQLPDVIVVRGLYHKEWLEKRGFKNVFFIPDGVDLTIFRPMNCAKLRFELKLANQLTVGFVGSIGWGEKVPRYNPGWDLIEVMRHVKGLPVAAVIIADGPGLEHLRRKAEETGVIENCKFLGRVPQNDLPHYLGLIDLCLLSLPDTLAGQVRTTGKLPEYLACERYVLASNVGTATYILKGTDMLLPVDNMHPRHVSYIVARLKRIFDDPSLLERRKIGRAIAQKYFDYKVLSNTLVKMVESVLRIRKAKWNGDCGKNGIYKL